MIRSQKANDPIEPHHRACPGGKDDGMDSLARKPEPFYTHENCRPSFQLNWSLALFWRAAAPTDLWLAELKTVLEPDGVRVLSHHAPRERVSQFLVSTKPDVSPADIVRLVKGRLQYIVREECPKAFCRNYFIMSIGPVTRDAVEEYVSSQLDHHTMADPRVQEMLKRYQLRIDGVDLSKINYSAHGEFIYSLHLVFVHGERWANVDERRLETANRMILRVSQKKGHRLSAIGAFADHTHIAIGCGVMEAPSEVALCYMNNLAYCQEMRRVYQYGYYVGTFGEYGWGAIVAKLKDSERGRGM